MLPLQMYSSLNNDDETANSFNNILMSSERRRRHPLSRRVWLPVTAIIFIIIITVYREKDALVLVTTSQHGTSNLDAGDRDAYAMAYRDSLWFFDYLTEKDWVLRKTLSRNRAHNLYPENPTKHADRPTSWYQENWDPYFTCAYEDKIGPVGDGHKWVCDPHRITKTDCVVYSVGSNGEFEFEMALQERLPQCEIHIFDLKDFSKDKPRGLKARFHPWGLKPSYFTNVTGWDTQFATQPWLDPTRKHLKFKTLHESLSELGHDHVTIFKVDCEGCEWQSYQDWVQEELQQILVEVHDSPPAEANRFFQSLHDANYVMFHKEPNTQFSNGRCQEIGFLKMARSFFRDP